MQTFLPYPNFLETVKVLDNKRLGKQRVEAKQILDIITGKSLNRWKNHPAVKMWQGYENALQFYLNYCILEWKGRGFKNTMKMNVVNNIKFPPWLGNEEFHMAYRSNLLRKNFEHYSKFDWKEPLDLPYIWPKI